MSTTGFLVPAARPFLVEQGVGDARDGGEQPLAHRSRHVSEFRTHKISF
jgi:hypothetical protein